MWIQEPSAEEDEWRQQMASTTLNTGQRRAKDVNRLRTLIVRIEKTNCENRSSNSKNHFQVTALVIREPSEENNAYLNQPYSPPNSDIAAFLLPTPINDNPEPFSRPRCFTSPRRSCFSPIELLTELLHAYLSV